MKLTLLNKAINNGKNSAKISSPEDFGNFIKNLSMIILPKSFSKLLKIRY